MARRTASTVLENEGTESTATATEEVVATEAPAAEVTEAPATESPEQAATDGATEAGERAEQSEAAPADGEADLTPFITVAEAVVGERDTSTGTLPDGGLDRVLTAYRELPDTKARNRAKKHLNEAMAKGLEEMDLGVAKAYLTLHDNMTTATAKAGGTPKAPADPKARWQQQLEIVTLAYGELVASAPEGVTPETVQEIVNKTGELSEDMAAQRAFLDRETVEGEDEPEAPTVDDRVKAAFRLVRGGKISGGGSARVSTPHDGPRRDIAKHIQSAFADLASGDFLTVAQIRAHKSEEYGDEAPSAGAISARLFPAKGVCTVEGVTPGTGGDKQQRGAYKA